MRDVSAETEGSHQRDRGPGENNQQCGLWQKQHSTQLYIYNAEFDAVQDMFTSNSHLNEANYTNNYQ